MRSCSIRTGLSPKHATHIFIVHDGEVATPRVLACPEGITRATVLEMCAANSIPHAETGLKLDDVYAAVEMFCTGTMGELAGVIKLDDRVIGGGEPGPITKRLSDLYSQRTATEGIQIV